MDGWHLFDDGYEFRCFVYNFLYFVTYLHYFAIVYFRDLLCQFISHWMCFMHFITFVNIFIVKFACNYIFLCDHNNKSCSPLLYLSVLCCRNMILFLCAIFSRFVLCANGIWLKKVIFLFCVLMFGIWICLDLGTLTFIFGHMYSSCLQFIIALFLFRYKCL